MHRLKLIKIGNSVGAIFPKDLLSELKVSEGDILIATDAPDGVRLTTYDAEIEEQIEAGRSVMRRYKHTLRALAK